MISPKFINENFIRLFYFNGYMLCPSTQALRMRGICNGGRMGRFGQMLELRLNLQSLAFMDISCGFDMKMSV